MERKWIWRILENPIIYRLSQFLFTRLDEGSIISEVRHLLGPTEVARRDLDVGCGPSSLLWRIALRPVGLDPTYSYLVRFRRKGSRAVMGSAIALPFQNDSYDGVWNFGLLHHLPDSLVCQALGEMVRVVRPGGRVVIFDGVMPESIWLNPFGWIIRKLDRGVHMRDQKVLESLLLDRERWSVKRLRSSLLGLEWVLCCYQKPGVEMGESADYNVLYLAKPEVNP